MIRHGLEIFLVCKMNLLKSRVHCLCNYQNWFTVSSKKDEQNIKLTFAKN